MKALAKRLYLHALIAANFTRSGVCFASAIVLIAVPFFLIGCWLLWLLDREARSR